MFGFTNVPSKHTIEPRSWGSGLSLSIGKIVVELISFGIFDNSRAHQILPIVIPILALDLHHAVDVFLPIRHVVGSGQCGCQPAEARRHETEVEIWLDAPPTLG